MEQQHDDELPTVHPWRAILLHEASEQRWAENMATFPEIRVSAGDWSAAEAWLDRKIASSPFRRASAEWTGGLVGMNPAILLSLSPALVPAVVARLRSAAGSSSTRAVALCLESLGWGEAPAVVGNRWTAYAEDGLGWPRPRILVEARGALSAGLERADIMASLRIPVGLRVEEQEWHDFLASDRWDRCATRWRRAETERSENWLKRVAMELLPSFEQTRQCTEHALLDTSGAAADRARSAVEALLFQVLETRPATRGRFRLNELLDFNFGGRPAEADLAARDARLAIEVDGYFHFRDEAAFRRDRRKDVLFQEHAWFFLRFLADDVMRDLESVVGEIERNLVRCDLTRRTSTCS